MSKRDPLRKLIKKFPQLGEIDNLWAALEKESDRSAAIVAAALLEGMLERVIEHRLLNKDRNLLGQLFNNRGPLSDFHSKILIGTALGIINPPMYHEFNRIKVIRNVFAHATDNVTFTTPEIASEMKDAYLIGVMRKASGEEDPLKELKPRRAFLLTVHIMMIAYDGFHQQMGGNAIARFFSDCAPAATSSRKSE